MSFNSRGTGKTTARVLQSIADALLHPDTPVAVVPDGFSANRAAQSIKDLENFAESIRGKCKCLGITLDVELAVHAVLLTSPITRMREEHNRKCDPTACDTKRSQQPFVTTIDVSLAESSFRSDSFLDGFGRPVRKVAAEEHQSKCDSITESDVKRAVADFRKAFPGRVLPKGTEIVQQQPTSEASKQDAETPNAQSDADRDFIRKLTNNRALRQVCHVVDSHMAKELGFQNLREYRDAVRASIVSFKTPPDQPQAQPPQDEIPEVSFPQEFKLMPQRWPEAVMKWNMKMNRYESRLFSVTTDRDHKYLAIVVKYSGKVSPEWVTECDGKELALHGVTAFA